MASRYYVTTPIYYINDVPHLGSAYTTIAADVMARYHRIRGQATRFLTGTDEHGLKVQRVADEKGETPLAYADAIAPKFSQAWRDLDCSFDDFFRTTEPRHAAGVQAIWKTIADKGDLYLGHYEGLYCVGCEAYYTEKELTQPGNLCPIHGTVAEQVKEESYFFKLSKYAQPLLDHIAKNPEFVQPVTRRNEVESFVRGGLEDLSVSRTTFKWGIPVPGDARHVMYVWFDALANYYTALTAEQKPFFPDCVHLVGKDIIRQHAVYWPTMLMAAGLPLPKQIYAHGFLTYGGQKMSKSLRNTVSPVDLARAISPEVGVDVVRYTLMRAISFGQDGDFSITDVLQRYHSELGNALGNLLNRVRPFAESVPEGSSPSALEQKLVDAHRTGAKAAAVALDDGNPTRALEAIWTVIAAANDYVDKSAPWAARKTGDSKRIATIVTTLVETLEAVSVMIAPVMPTVSARVRTQLGLAPLTTTVGEDRWPFDLPTRAPGGVLTGGDPIFPRLEKEKHAELVARFSPPPPAAPPAEEAASKPAANEAAAPADRAVKATIAYDDFAKLDLRVGLVISAERIKKKDMLLDLRVDTGDPAPRRIVSGIAKAYAPEDLVGQRIVVVCNLAPKAFGKGLVSEGMLLTGDGPAGLKFLSIDPSVPPGTPVA